MKKSLNLIGYFTTEFAVHWVFCRFLSLDLSFFGGGTMVFWGFHAGRPEAFVARCGHPEKSKKKKKKQKKKKAIAFPVPDFVSR